MATVAISISSWPYDEARARVLGGAHVWDLLVFVNLALVFGNLAP